MYEKYQKKLENLLDTKLEKTEKVELASVDDLKKLKQEYMETYADAGEVRKLGVQLNKKARSSFEYLSKIENKIKENLRSFKQKAKDLGIKEESVKEYNELNSFLKSAKNYLKIYKQAMEYRTL